jgi:hypothetical protein
MPNVETAMTSDTRLPRATWSELSDPQLLAQCAVDTYRASGPGGQKRNKTSSAVRLRHLPTSLIVIAEESRSQHENRARALKRLRQALYLKLRESIAGDGMPEPWRDTVRSAFDRQDRLNLGIKDSRFWPVAGIVLDVLLAQEARVAPTASALGITTGNLIEFLQTSPKLWEQANILRGQFGHKPLKDT